ncbi:hypothetical protein LY76DRAFT_59652 [Colletotrichum caudatum]|nr:hypothetical protein LY76DRAFT_59652 [Colletotrichum caudatum]
MGTVTAIEISQTNTNLTSSRVAFQNEPWWLRNIVTKPKGSSHPSARRTVEVKRVPPSQTNPRQYSTAVVTLQNGSESGQVRGKDLRISQAQSSSVTRHHASMDTARRKTRHIDGSQIPQHMQTHSAADHDPAPLPGRHRLHKQSHRRHRRSPTVIGALSSPRPTDLTFERCSPGNARAPRVFFFFLAAPAASCSCFQGRKGGGERNRSRE